MSRVSSNNFSTNVLHMSRSCEISGLLKTDYNRPGISLRFKIEQHKKVGYLLEAKAGLFLLILFNITIQMHTRSV